jgi:multidrug efflux pump subunit AcrA (membrane-fusion protein)
LVFAGYFGYTNFFKKENRDGYILAKVERKTISVSVSGSGNVEAEKEIDLKCEVSGKILEILCKEGDRVKKGDILIKLDSENAREEINLAQRAIEDAEKSLENAKKGVEDAKSALEDAKISFENLQKNYEKTKRDLDNSLKETYKETLDTLSLFYNVEIIAKQCS